MNPARTPQFYMANLGSEIVGIYSAIARGDGGGKTVCYARAKKIINDFRQLEKRQSALAEVGKIEEIVEDLMSDVKKFAIPKADIENYFLPFATRLMSV